MCIRDSCAADRSRAPLTGQEVRACWEAAPAVPVAPGLFSELDTSVPTEPELAVAPAWPRPAAKAAKPPLEELQAAAWVEVPVGGLTEAPHVEPGRKLMSEVERRRRRLWGRR
jgi:hypothetical protein